jgi:IS5 family transposase
LRINSAYEITDASVHNSQVIGSLLRSTPVYADSAYQSDEIDGILFAQRLNTNIQERAYRNKSLTDAQKASNTFKSRKRSRVEHVFAGIKNTMRRMKLRCVGLVRAKFNIGLMNLTYNLKHVATLSQLRFFGFLTIFYQLTLDLC